MKRGKVNIVIILPHITTTNLKSFGNSYENKVSNLMLPLGQDDSQEQKQTVSLPSSTPLLTTLCHDSNEWSMFG